MSATVEHAHGVNLWRTMSGWVRRLFVGSTAAAGLLFSSVAWPISQEYPALDAMSTMARFPWIVVCVNIIADDLAGRPILATRPNRKQRRAKGEEVDDPALDLLEQPNATTTGFLFRKQLWVDQLLAGNSYIWAPEGRDSVAIYRLHPHAVRPLPGPMGMVAAYEWTEPDTGEKRMLPPDQVIHIRDVSWQDNVQAVFGESVVRCLHDQLTTEIGARTTAKEMAQKGRPDILFNIEGELGDAKAEAIVGRWEKAMKARHGAFVAGGGMKAQQLSWTPKEFDFSADRKDLRDTTLAVFGVPPSRVGLSEDANYATARQAEKTYWERNRSRCRIFDDAFSQLAQPGIRLSHDFSDIEALQVSYTERQARVVTWVSLGWDPEDAAAYEGFEDLPPRRADVAPSSSSTPAAGGSSEGAEREEPNEPADKAVRLAVHKHLRCAEAAYTDLQPEMSTALLVRGLTEMLATDLQAAGLAPELARSWAAETVAITDEAARMGLEGAFGEGRAARITASIRRAA